jgi:transposase
MTRSEILEGPERRRRWSDEEKASILAELSKPGSNGAEVARRHGVARSLIYAWRKELKAPLRTAGGAAVTMPFAHVLLAGPAPMAETQAALPTAVPTIEIEMKGVRVRLPGSAPSSMVASAIKALRGRS